MSAARFGQTDVVELLLDTGRIESDIFDKAFESAVRSGNRKPDTAIFLYNTKLASAEVITQAFQNAHDVSVLRLLYENEEISDDSVNAAFKHAADCYSKTQALIL